MSFQFRCLIGKVDDEDEDGENRSLGSTATSFPVLDMTLLLEDTFLVLFRKLRHVLVNTLADDYPGWNSVCLHRIDLDYHFKTVKMCCTFDFHDRINFGVASNVTFRFTSVIISRMRILST